MSPKTGWWSPHLGQHFGWLDPPCLLFRSPVTLSKRFGEPCWAVEAPCSSSFSHLQFVAEKGRQLVGPDVNVLTKISTHMQQKWGLRWMSTKIWWFHVISNIYFGSLNPWQWSHLTNYSYMTICRVRQLLVYPYCAVWAGLDLYNLDQLAHLPLKTSMVNDWAWYRCRQLSRFGFADRAGFYIYRWNPNDQGRGCDPEKYTSFGQVRLKLSSGQISSWTTTTTPRFWTTRLQKTDRSLPCGHGIARVLFFFYQEKSGLPLTSSNITKIMNI